MNGTKLTGLYKCQRKKDGKTYLTGKLNRGARLLVLPNDQKQADNEPDFNVFVVPIVEEAPDQAGGAASGYKPATARPNQWQQPNNAGARPTAPQSPEAAPAPLPARRPTAPPDDL